MVVHSPEYRCTADLPTIGGVPRLVVASEALANGLLTRRELNRDYTLLYRNVYLHRNAELTAEVRAVAAWLWSRRTATVAGLSAAAVLGSKYVPAQAPAELARAGQWSPPGIAIHMGELRDDEVRLVRGMPCTTATRTAYDLGRQLPLTEAVIRIDALLNATGVATSDVACLAMRYPGARHISRFRRAIDLADAGAESPQETRVRLVLIRGGLPRPVTQIPFYRDDGRVRRRVDMGWPEWQVGVEYDGVQHWQDPQQYATDIERLEFFADLNWRIVRVSSTHLRRPDDIVRRAWRALRLAGYPG